MTMELFREYRLHPTRNLRDRIFKQHHKLAYEIAHQFQSCNVPFDDLVQLTSLGLIMAIERFDPSKGFAFSSFACPYMRGEIYHYIRDKLPLVRIPRPLLSLYQRGRKLQEEASKREVNLTDKQTAIALGVDELKWREACKACTSRHVSIESLLKDTEENTPDFDYTTQAFSAIEQRLSVQDKQTHQQLSIEVLPLDKLDESSRQLLEMLFLENRPFHQVRQVAIARGIKAKDVKPLLVNAVLSLV